MAQPNFNPYAYQSYSHDPQLTISDMSGTRSQPEYQYYPSNMVETSNKDFARNSTGSAQSATRPIFYCVYEPCARSNVHFARKADLERHLSVIHSRETLQLVDCEYTGCHRRGQDGFTRKDKMRDHMREVHKVDIAKRQNNRRTPQ